jgi:hypothetical protein
MKATVAFVYVHLAAASRVSLGQCALMSNMAVNADVLSAGFRRPTVRRSLLRYAPSNLMTLTSQLQVALVVLCLASLTGCARCGDAIICPSPPSEDFPSNAVPVVRMHGDSVRFEAPRSLQRYQHYAIERVYVYEVIGGRGIWQIDSKTKGLKVAEMAKYNPRTPLIYGQAIEGTVLTIPPSALKIGKDYNMRGDFIGYDQSSVLSAEYIKVTFRLKQENGQLRVEQLPTKRAN